MDRNDLKFLVDYLNQKNISSRIRIVSLPTDENDNNEISRITIIDKNGTVYDKIINLNDWIDKNKPPVTYQDNVRFVYSASQD